MIDLHDDQERYVERVVADTGLDRDVVAAWVVASAGPDVYRPGHNYLTDGFFPSTDTAAAAAVTLIDAHGLRPLNVLGVLPQIDALGSHPAFPGTPLSILAAWSKGRV